MMIHSHVLLRCRCLYVILINIFEVSFINYSHCDIVIILGLEKNLTSLCLFIQATTMVEHVIVFALGHSCNFKVNMLLQYLGLHTQQMRLYKGN
jgi:hypothetical protein